MTIKIFGRLSSANVQKVVWFCNEADLSFKSFILGGVHGGTKTDMFIKMNPNSRVPVINDDDYILYESNAILRYLSIKYQFLKSNDYKLQGTIDQWIDWASFTLGSQCSLLTAHKLSLPKENRDHIIAEQASLEIYNLLSILEKNLKINKYIVEKDFSLADIPLGVWIHRCINLNIKLNNFKKIENWYSRIKKRNAFKISVLHAPLPPN